MQQREKVFLHASIQIVLLGNVFYQLSNVYFVFLSELREM